MGWEDLRRIRKSGGDILRKCWEKGNKRESANLGETWGVKIYSLGIYFNRKKCFVEKKGGGEGGILEEKSFLKRNLQVIQKGTLGRLKIYSRGIYFKRRK